MNIEKATCDNCSFMTVDPISNHPICRRYPPTGFQAVVQNSISGRPEQITGSMYPPVKVEGWCGEHKRQLAVTQ